MAKSIEVSSGLFLYDIINNEPKILLVYPGGPYFSQTRKPKMWSVPKGRTEPGEELLQTAIREFKEETSIIPQAPYTSLGNVVYNSGKTVYAYIFKGTFNGKIVSNCFSAEWPPRSGIMRDFPENSDGKMFNLKEAKEKILVSQEPFIDKIEQFFKSKNIL